MADPITPNVNALQAQINTNHQQFIGAFDAARENERIKNFIAKHKEDLKQEADIISDGLSHNDKIVRHKEPIVKRFPEDEKTEQRIEDEKKERIERNTKSMDGNYLKELEKDLSYCRGAYADVENGEGARLAEVRKKLNSKGVNLEESVALSGAREQYQKTLDRFKDAKIAELKEKGLKGEPLEKEMFELIKRFGYMEALELSNARNEAKAESNMGKNIAMKCWGMLEKTGNAYNKLPMWKKLLFTGAGVAGGLALTTGAVASSAAITAVSGAVAAKRLFGAALATVGTAKGLDALHQVKASRAANKDVKKVIGEMDKIYFEGTSDENAEKRYEIMRAALDVKLAEADKHLKNRKMISLCNKFIGVGVGVFLGSGMASRAIAGAAEYFNPSEHATGAGAIAKSGASSLENAKVPLDVPVSESIEKTLTIEKGSSIEKTLIDHLKATHPEMKNPGEAAHRMWLDYMDDNKEDIIKKVGNGEYQKMLKDGMVNVKPGTTLIIDEHNPLKLELHDIGGEISHLEHAHVENVEISDAKIGNVDARVPSEDVPSKISENVSTEVLDKANHEFVKIEKEMQVEGEVGRLSELEKTEIARIDMDVLPNDVDAETFGHKTELLNQKNAEMKLLSELRAEDAPWDGAKGVSELLSKNAGSHQILQFSLDKITSGHGILGKSAYWNMIKDMSFIDAVNEGGKSNEAMKSLVVEFRGIIGEEALPKKDLSGNYETTRKWLARVTDLAIKAKKG